MQKRLNLSICLFDCGLQCAKGCTSSIVFARCRQCALMEGHVVVTCPITLNHPSTAANYFDHLFSFDTPTYTVVVAQIAKRFEPSTVLWAFRTIEPCSYLSALCLFPTAHTRYWSFSVPDEHTELKYDRCQQCRVNIVPYGLLLGVCTRYYGQRSTLCDDCSRTVVPGDEG